MVIYMRIETNNINEHLHFDYMSWFCDA